MTARTALESTGFLALARIVVPALLAGNIAAGSYWAKTIYDRQEFWFLQFNEERIKNAAINSDQNARLAEIERRLNSRRSPISDVRGFYSIVEP